MLLLEALEHLIQETLTDEVIYINNFPESSVDNIITIYNYGGNDPDMAFSVDVIYNPKIQIRVRDVDEPNAYRRLVNISKTLIGNSFEDDDIIILAIYQYNDILQLGIDNRGRTELILNFKIKHKYK